MKILKLKIRKQRKPGHCHYIYPDCWDAKKIHVLAYEDHPENLGEVKEDCLCVTDDQMAGELLKLPEVREISKQEANAFGRRWRPAVAFIDDSRKITGIFKKLLSKPDLVEVLKKYLSKKEIDSLDEEKTELGIRKKPKFDIEGYLTEKR